MLKLIKKIIKRFIQFIADFWFIHLLEVFWLTITIAAFILHSESVAAKILLAVEFFLCGMMEGYLLYLEIDG